MATGTVLVTVVWAAVAASAALVVSYAVAWQRLGSAWGFGVLGQGHVAAALAGEVVLAMLTARPPSGVDCERWMRPSSSTQTPHSAAAMMRRPAQNDGFR